MANVPSSLEVPTDRPQVATPDASFQPRVPLAAVGGAQAEGLQQLGTSALRVGTQWEQIGADDVANQFSDDANKILHGDPDKTITNPDGTTSPDVGYLGLKGADALNQRPIYEKRLNDLFKQARGKILTPNGQREFDNLTRRYRTVISSQMGTHADTQAANYGLAVSESSVKGAAQRIASNPEDEDSFLVATNDMVKGAVRTAQLRYGANADPALINQAVNDAKAAAVQTRVMAIGANDPARALQIADGYKEVLGPHYSPLADHLRARADKQIGEGAATTAIASAVTAPYTPRDGTAVTPDLLHQATVGQESGGRQFTPQGTVLTSPKGAQGLGQITQATFDRFALPGEKIENAKDNAAVSKRITDYYMQKYNGDWARASVAYFSGEGNVSPPGALTPWVTDASDGRKLTSQYVSDMATRLGVKSPQQARADAMSGILTNPNLNDSQRAHALAKIERDYRASEIASLADQKAKREANDAAANEYVPMFENPPPDIVHRIDNDSRLTWETKLHLRQLAQTSSGEEDTASFGPGYADTYNRIMAAPGAENRISDANDILRMGAPGGTLTGKGVQRLLGVLNASRKDVDQAGVHTAKSGLLSYAKSKLSFQGYGETLGYKGLMDPKGEAVFNSEFIPKFESAYSDWVKAGKNPYEFLTRENIDKMITGMRPAAEMHRDLLAASGQAPITGGESAPKEEGIPAAPQGVNENSWRTIVSQPPTSRAGRWPVQLWSQWVERLRANPTPQAIAAFNAKFGPGGYDAQEILSHLNKRENAMTPEESAATLALPQ